MAKKLTKAQQIEQLQDYLAELEFKKIQKSTLEEHIDHITNVGRLGRFNSVQSEIENIRKNAQKKVQRIMETGEFQIPNSQGVRRSVNTTSAPKQVNNQDQTIELLKARLGKLDNSEHNDEHIRGVILEELDKLNAKTKTIEAAKSQAQAKAQSSSTREIISNDNTRTLEMIRDLEKKLDRSMNILNAHEANKQHAETKYAELNAKAEEIARMHFEQIEVARQSIVAKIYEANAFVETFKASKAEIEEQIKDNLNLRLQISELFAKLENAVVEGKKADVLLAQTIKAKDFKNSQSAWDFFNKCVTAIDSHVDVVKTTLLVSKIAYTHDLGFTVEQKSPIESFKEEPTEQELPPIPVLETPIETPAVEKVAQPAEETPAVEEVAQPVEETPAVEEVAQPAEEVAETPELSPEYVAQLKQEATTAQQANAETEQILIHNKKLLEEARVTAKTFIELENLYKTLRESTLAKIGHFNEHVPHVSIKTLAKSINGQVASIDKQIVSIKTLFERIVEIADQTHVYLNDELIQTYNENVENLRDSITAIINLTDDVDALVRELAAVAEGDVKAKLLAVTEDAEKIAEAAKKQAQETDKVSEASEAVEEKEEPAAPEQKEIITDPIDDMKAAVEAHVHAFGIFQKQAELTQSGFAEYAQNNQVDEAQAQEINAKLEAISENAKNIDILHDELELAISENRVDDANAKLAQIDELVKKSQDLYEEVKTSSIPAEVITNAQEKALSATSIALVPVETPIEEAPAAEQVEESTEEKPAAAPLSEEEAAQQIADVRFNIENKLKEINVFQKQAELTQSGFAEYAQNNQVDEAQAQEINAKLEAISENAKNIDILHDELELAISENRVDDANAKLAQIDELVKKSQDLYEEVKTSSIPAEVITNAQEKAQAENAEITIEGKAPLVLDEAAHKQALEHASKEDIDKSDDIRDRASYIIEQYNKAKITNEEKLKELEQFVDQEFAKGVLEKDFIKQSEHLKDKSAHSLDGENKLLTIHEELLIHINILENEQAEEKLNNLQKASDEAQEVFANIEKDIDNFLEHAKNNPTFVHTISEENALAIATESLEKFDNYKNNIIPALVVEGNEKARVSLTKIKTDIEASVATLTEDEEELKVSISENDVHRIIKSTKKFEDHFDKIVLHVNDFKEQVASAKAQADAEEAARQEVIYTEILAAIETIEADKASRIESIDASIKQLVEDLASTVDFVKLKELENKLRDQMSALQIQYKDVEKNIKALQKAINHKEFETTQELHGKIKNAIVEINQDFEALINQISDSDKLKSAEEASEQERRRAVEDMYGPKITESHEKLNSYFTMIDDVIASINVAADKVMPYRSQEEVIALKRVLNVKADEIKMLLLGAKGFAKQASTNLVEVDTIAISNSLRHFDNQLVLFDNLVAQLKEDIEKFATVSDDEAKRAATNTDVSQKVEAILADVEARKESDFATLHDRVKEARNIAHEKGKPKTFVHVQISQLIEPSIKKLSDLYFEFEHVAFFAKKLLEHHRETVAADDEAQLETLKIRIDAEYDKLNKFITDLQNDDTYPKHVKMLEGEEKDAYLSDTASQVSLLGSRVETVKEQIWAKLPDLITNAIKEAQVWMDKNSFMVAKSKINSDKSVLEIAIKNAESLISKATNSKTTLEVSQAAVELEKATHQLEINGKNLLDLIEKTQYKPEVSDSGVVLSQKQEDLIEKFEAELENDRARFEKVETEIAGKIDEVINEALASAENYVSEEVYRGVEKHIVSEKIALEKAFAKHVKLLAKAEIAIDSLNVKVAHTTLVEVKKSLKFIERMIEQFKTEVAKASHQNHVAKHFVEPTDENDIAKWVAKLARRIQKHREAYAKLEQKLVKDDAIESGFEESIDAFMAPIDSELLKKAFKAELDHIHSEYTRIGEYIERADSALSMQKIGATLLELEEFDAQKKIIDYLSKSLKEHMEEVKKFRGVKVPLEEPDGKTKSKKLRDLEHKYRKGRATINHFEHRLDVVSKEIKHSLAQASKYDEKFVIEERRSAIEANWKRIKKQFEIGKLSLVHLRKSLDEQNVQEAIQNYNMYASAHKRFASKEHLHKAYDSIAALGKEDIVSPIAYISSTTIIAEALLGVALSVLIFLGIISI